MAFRAFLIAFAVVAVACAQDARAAVSLIAGGGWTAPRGDSAAYTRNGLTGGGAVELELGSNLGVALGGAYTGFGLRSSKLKADLDLPADDPLTGNTRIIDITLAPKLYLLNHDIAAYVLLGAGPRWLSHRTTAAGTGMKSTRTEQAWGVAAGFGGDIDFNGFRVGFAPTYHRINTDRRAVQYATFVFYLKL